MPFDICVSLLQAPLSSRCRIYIVSESSSSASRTYIPGPRLLLRQYQDSHWDVNTYCDYDSPAEQANLWYCGLLFSHHVALITAYRYLTASA